MKKAKRSINNIRTFTLAFIITLILLFGASMACVSYVNTASVIYGEKISVLEGELTQEDTIRFSVFRNNYLIDLKQVEKWKESLSDYYVLVPRNIRLFLGFNEYIFDFVRPNVYPK